MGDWYYEPDPDDPTGETGRWRHDPDAPTPGPTPPPTEMLPIVGAQQDVTDLMPPEDEHAHGGDE